MLEHIRQVRKQKQLLVKREFKSKLANKLNSIFLAKQRTAVTPGVASDAELPGAQAPDLSKPPADSTTKVDKEIVGQPPVAHEVKPAAHEPAPLDPGVCKDVKEAASEENSLEGKVAEATTHLTGEEADTLFLLCLRKLEMCD